MGYTRRGFKGGARQTTLVGDIGDTATVGIVAADLSTWAGAFTNGPATGTFDLGGLTEEEFTFTGISSNTFTGVTRGTGGTTAQAHTSGVSLDHTSSVTDFDEANAHIASTSLDHHTQYAKTDGTRTITGKQTYTVAAAGTAFNVRRAADAAGSGLSISPFGAAAVNFASGAENDGTTSTARAASATQVELLNATVNLYVDTGLTPGSTYTRTKTLAVDSSGLQVGSTVSAPGGSPFTIRIANTGNVPTGTPTNGGWLWVEGGALKFKGTSGTVTTLAAA